MVPALVLHLRNVHLTLFLIAIAAFLFSITPRKLDLPKLDKEYGQFETFINAVTENSDFVAAACHKLEKELSGSQSYESVSKNDYETERGYFYIKSVIKNKTHNWKVKAFREKSMYCELALDSGFRQYSIGNVNDVYRHVVGFGGDLSKNTNNLIQFVDLWNGFHKGIAIHRLLQVDYEKGLVIHKFSRSKLINPDLVEANIVLVNKPGTVAVRKDTVYHLSLVRNRIKSLVKLLDSGEYKSLDFYLFGSAITSLDNHQNYYIIIPVSSTVQYYPIQAEMFSQFGLNLIQSDFRNAFPALYKFINKHRGLYQKIQLKKAISDYKKLDLDTYNIVGIAYRTKDISRLSCFVIIAVMLYYWLLLRGLVMRVRSDQRVFTAAWIGLFPDKISYLTTLITVLLVPAGVCSMILYRYFNYTSDYEAVLFWSTVSLLFLFSFLILFSSFRLKRLALKYR